MVLHRTYRSTQKQKISFAGHVLRGSSGDSALQILEWKQERRRRMWIDDIKYWMKLKTHEEIQRIAQDRCQ